MIYHIPARNWSTALAEAIDAAQDGDTIAVASATQQRLAAYAVARMCPDKDLAIIVMPYEEEQPWTSN